MEINNTTIITYYSSRLFGFAPYKLTRDKFNQICGIKFSRFLCAYSVFTVTAFSLLTNYGLYYDTHSVYPIRWVQGCGCWMPYFCLYTAFAPHFHWQFPFNFLWSLLPQNEKSNVEGSDRIRCECCGQFVFHWNADQCIWIAKCAAYELSSEKGIRFIKSRSCSNRTLTHSNTYPGSPACELCERDISVQFSINWAILPIFTLSSHRLCYACDVQSSIHSFACSIQWKKKKLLVLRSLRLCRKLHNCAVRDGAFARTFVERQY